MTQPGAPLTQEALLKVSGLLADIRKDMAHVTRLVSDLSAHEAITLSPSQITDLQTLDHICQSLSDLVVVTDTLAKASDASPEAEDKLQLAATRSILSPAPTRKDEIITGSIELF